MNLPVSVVILTYNEEQNLKYCLESVKGLAEEIFIVDSYSTDKTIEIGRQYTDKIFQHPFENQSRQINWALDNLPIKSEWVLRLDADESVTQELKNELTLKLPALKDGVSGLYVKRRVFFMNKWMKHGGYYPTWLLRIWRNGKGYCEDRCVDEHIRIREGEVLFLDNDIIDNNRKSLGWWINKHNDYATREAAEMINLMSAFSGNGKVPSDLLGTQEQRKRWIKEKVYARMPLFLRPFIYFNYRYFLRLGFLDGKEGLIWHLLQGFWYRFLVDAKVYEYKKAGKRV